MDCREQVGSIQRAGPSFFARVSISAVSLWPWHNACVCVCVYVWVKADSQTPQRDPAHSGHWPKKKKRQNATIWWNSATDWWGWKFDREKICVNWVSLCVLVSEGRARRHQWAIISSNGLLVVFVFQYGKHSLLLMRFDQWAHSEASKQPPLAGWKKQTTATFVSRHGRHFVSILTSFAAAAIEMLKQFLPPFLHLMFVIFAGLNSWKQS